jgi:hypothetical protein
MITKIISGGQTGGDFGGLLAAKELNISTGGTAPKGYRTELGSNFDLRDIFNLSEHSSDKYPPRTAANVKNSDGTVLFGNMNSPGCKMTIKFCQQMNKPYIINPSVNQLREWINLNNIRILNCAGNRESKNIGIQERVKNHLVRALTV